MLHLTRLFPSFNNINFTCGPSRRNIEEAMNAMLICSSPKLSILYLEIIILSAVGVRGASQEAEWRRTDIRTTNMKSSKEAEGLFKTSPSQTARTALWQSSASVSALLGPVAGPSAAVWIDSAGEEKIPSLHVVINIENTCATTHTTQLLLYTCKESKVEQEPCEVFTDDD